MSRAESLVGTASTVRAFLLVEFAGAWGRDALRDARLPSRVRARLAAASKLGIKTLLVRRHGRSAVNVLAHVFVAYAGLETSWLETTHLDAIEELPDLDLEALSRGERLGLSTLSGPLVCVCTHGRHDPCCAELGRPLAAALHHSHPDLVWEASHIGGDRFAGNVLVLPDGLYYGRVAPYEASALIEGHLSGHLDLEHLRGRSTYPFASQAAEWHLRRQLDETGLDAVRLVRQRRDEDHWTTDFSVGAATWRVTLRADRRDPERLTCAASRPSPSDSFVPIHILELPAAT